MEISDVKIFTFKLPEEIILYDSNYIPQIYSPYSPDKVTSPKHNAIELGRVKIPTNLIPKFTEQTMTFKIDNTLPAFTNSIRRVLQSELSTMALHVDTSTFKTDDPVMDFDKLDVIVSSIAINQEKVNLSDRFYINVKNSDISSAGSILTKNIKNKKEENLVDLGLCNLIDLCALYPGKSLYVELEVKLLSGSTIGQHSAATRVCMDVLSKPNENNKKYTYRFSFSTNGNTNIKKLLLSSFDFIIERYDKLLLVLEKSIISVTTDNVYTFGFNLETHTIAEPIALEGSQDAYKDKISFISTQKGVEPVINVLIKFIKIDITKEEALKIVTNLILKCRDQFKLSKESKDYINIA